MTIQESKKRAERDIFPPAANPTGVRRRSRMKRRGRCIKPRDCCIKVVHAQLFSLFAVDYNSDRRPALLSPRLTSRLRLKYHSRVETSTCVNFHPQVCSYYSKTCICCAETFFHHECKRSDCHRGDTFLKSLPPLPFVGILLQTALLEMLEAQINGVLPHHLEHSRGTSTTPLVTSTLLVMETLMTV